MWLMTCCPFFLCTWEEYYTGELYFPIFHGASEGTLAACTAMHLTGFLGRDFWFEKVNFLGTQMQINHLATTMCASIGIGFGIWSVQKVLINFKDKRDDALNNLFIFIYLISSLFVVVMFSESELLNTYPKLIVLLYGFAFAKLVGHLQLAHLAGAKFMQYRKSILTSFFVLGTISVVNYFLNSKIVNIDIFIIGCLIMHIIVYIHFAVYVTEELCQTLKIHRFTITKRTD